MTEKVNISGIDIYLTNPVEIDMKWVGDENIINQLKAAWLVIEEGDIPLTPRILGKPGIGKTTLAYATGKKLKQEVYIFQCTMDTRPEDLLISPVIASDKTIKYMGSSLVSAMVKGGICLLDEGNRMSEKSWASLAPLMDKRRYIESIITGVRIFAHPDFRLCITMNSDSSTYEVPEYILSRMIKIQLDFPSKPDEFKILKYNIPFSSEEILTYCVEFLQNAHIHEEPYVIRDGIKILRLYLKTRELQGKDKNELNKEEFKEIIKNIYHKNAVKYCPDEYNNFLEEEKDNFDET
ncbi:MAG: AAA family ATPase [Candidatus Lokiarchaeota archaeon]|nr:AAA family ATPase [Candidatus Lokiarchaeota archaeon]